MIVGCNTGLIWRAASAIIILSVGRALADPTLKIILGPFGPACVDCVPVNAMNWHGPTVELLAQRYPDISAVDPLHPKGCHQDTYYVIGRFSRLSAELRERLEMHWKQGDYISDLQVDVPTDIELRCSTFPRNTFVGPVFSYWQHPERTCDPDSGRADHTHNSGTMSNGDTCNEGHVWHGCPTDRTW
jgi:hypothetical protein